MLARFVRTRGGISPDDWRQVPVESASQAVGAALADGLSHEVAVDLLDLMIAPDVEGPDVFEAFVCATAQLLVEVDPHEDHQDRIDELLAAVPKGARWLLLGCLREAPDHDQAATDLRSYLPLEGTVDVDRLASKAGRRGTLSTGLTCLDAMVRVLGDAIGIPRDVLMALTLPGALVEHDLLHSRPAD